jgi:hypothetical protein
MKSTTSAAVTKRRRHDKDEANVRLDVGGPADDSRIPLAPMPSSSSSSAAAARSPPTVTTTAAAAAGRPTNRQLERVVAVGVDQTVYRDKAMVASIVVMVAALFLFALSLTPWSTFVSPTAVGFFTSYSFLVLLPCLAVWPLALVQVNNRLVPASSVYPTVVLWYEVVCLVFAVFELCLACVDVSRLMPNFVPASTTTLEGAVVVFLVVISALVLVVGLVATLFFQWSLVDERGGSSRER